MSSDNGIYILNTPTPSDIIEADPSVIFPREYRVKELMAIENLEYDEDAPDPMQFRPNYGNDYHSVNEMLPETSKFYEQHKKYQEAYDKKYHSSNPDVLIRNARKMWRGCAVFNTEADALVHAANLLRESFICEYGISFITIERVF